MTEEDLPFKRVTIPELIQEHQEQTEQKRDYGNKYMINKTTISIAKSLFERLEKVQAKTGLKTKGELLEYLADVEETFNPKLETVFKCKKCNEQVQANTDMNLDRLIHKDLCKSTQCTGSIITKQKIVKETASGTTETKTDANEQNEQNEQKDREKIKYIEYNKESIFDQPIKDDDDQIVKEIKEKRKRFEERWPAE